MSLILFCAITYTLLLPPRFSLHHSQASLTMTTFSFLFSLSCHLYVCTTIAILPFLLSYHLYSVFPYHVFSFSWTFVTMPKYSFPFLTFMSSMFTPSLPFSYFLFHVIYISPSPPTLFCTNLKHHLLWLTCPLLFSFPCHLCLQHHYHFPIFPLLSQLYTTSRIKSSLPSCLPVLRHLIRVNEYCHRVLRAFPWWLRVHHNIPT